MDKVKKLLSSFGSLRFFIWFKNLNIKHSFMACMLIFIVIFLSFFIVFLEYADYRSDRIMSFYNSTQELPTDSVREYPIDNKNITVIMKNEDDRALGDGMLFYISKYYIFLFIALFVVSIVFAGFAFYYLKLKIPLGILRNASEKISANELDFTLEYERTDEMGALIRSFEKMRSALYDNNRKMWNTIDEESKVYAAFAHDVRTPLTVVHGYTDFLETYIPDKKISEEKLLSTLHTVNENLVRLQNFVDTMSAIRTLDDLNVRIRKVNFNDLCLRLEEEAGIICSGIKCEFSRETDSPYANIDENTAEQVFGNLTSNAMRYAINCIRISFVTKNNITTITVNDDGEGFSDEALRRGSELFYHEASAGTDSHFGFGLHICKTLCEKHGGCLTIYNNNGGCVSASFSGNVEDIP